MRGIAGFLIAAVALAALGGIFLRTSRIERGMADARQHVATLMYAEAQQSLDSAERDLAYGRWIPGVGAAALKDVRAQKAAVQYWERRYDALVPTQADPVAAIEGDNIDLQLIVANAAYRQGQAKPPGDRQAVQQTLEEAVSGYLTVLKNSTWNENAAYNYEYLVRLRDEAARGRRPPPREEKEDGDLGQSGAPSEATSQKGFEIYIPLESDERPQGGDAGKASSKDRKG